MWSGDGRMIEQPGCRHSEGEKVGQSRGKFRGSEERKEVRSMRGDELRHGMRGWPRKKKRGQPGRPPARGTRTIRMCSFDARNRGSTRPPSKRGSKKPWQRSGRVACWSPVLAERAASEGPRPTRAMGDQTGHPPKKGNEQAQKGREGGSLVVLLLAERARSECARSTRAIEDQPGCPRRG